ncbi:ATP-binding protein, partial [Proteus mirabilis]
YLSAIEHVVDHAVGQLDTKSQFLLKKERNGLIYIDAWGELTAFEQIDSLRDVFTLNIIPRNIVKKYSIKNFSCKI